MRNVILKYAKEKFGTEPEYLWSGNPNFAVLRQKETGKWYALIMDIPKVRLGLDGTDIIDVINVKCPPDLIGSLLQGKGYFPAYHMNKENWITIDLSGSVPKEEIFNLINLSYELTEK